MTDIITRKLHMLLLTLIASTREDVDLILNNSEKFISIWNTQDSTYIRIPTDGEGYDYNVFWERLDLPSIKGILGSQEGDVIIEGLEPFTNYKVVISGYFPRIYVNNAPLEKDKIFEVTQWGSNAWKSMEKAFRGCSNLNITALDVPDLSLVTNCQGMFEDCISIKSSDANWNWNISSVINTSNMFKGAINFDQSNINWDLQSVKLDTDMF